MNGMTGEHPGPGDDWIGLLGSPLPVEQAARWVVRPDCGAVVTFSGTARDHSPGVEGVTRLDYEAYEEHVERSLASVVADARAKWPEVGRVVVLHRVGPVAVGESSVVVAVSAPHRQEAFEAARHCIDTLKETAPIWKREVVGDGEVGSP
jgi:molybdopterin synthase catalytic subunit